MLGVVRIGAVRRVERVQEGNFSRPASLASALSKVLSAQEVRRAEASRLTSIQPSPLP